jgi:Flp pilus assembly secretin CpaC
MKMIKNCLTFAVLLCFVNGTAHAQAIRGLPYSAQLATDPVVGNVQGVQRYGRPLKTDPDEGEGYSYHVYPVAHFSNGSQSNGPVGDSASYSTSRHREILTELQLLDQKATQLSATGALSSDPQLQRIDSDRKILNLEMQIEALKAASQFVPEPAPFTGPYSGTFDATLGLRQGFAEGGLPADALPFAAAYNPKKVSELFTIYHQPLIQIKIRVVEVVRGDGLASQSVLEYVSRRNVNPSLTTGSPLNRNAAGQGFENTRSLSRFAIPGLISDATTGSGLLVNLTTQHINYIATLLATELNADIVTAPQVVTLNGQNVEFVAGSKLPFNLGQNVINGDNNNIQQFFYKHVGTFVSVTPRIVNFGFHGEGGGEAAIVASDITSGDVRDWNALAEAMLDTGNFSITDEQFRLELGRYVQNDRPAPFELKKRMLLELNKYTRSDAATILKLADLHVIDPDVCDSCRNWKPEDCTIDMSIVVRLSEPGSTETITATTGGDEATVTVINTENNVRAVANVIQVKSGNGVVMAGLIGEREVEDTDKIPILGDIPGLGFLFRSKQVNRQKTEVLIFVEAEVLPSDANHSRARSSEDFVLGAPYVEGQLLDNPLEFGLYRVGFGSYLPPHTPGEAVYWERFGRKVRKVHTHLHDMVE